MLYFTQLIYISEGKEQVFHDFEDKVLPLLEKYNGKLLYRVRPAQSNIIATAIGAPYEIHIVSFATKEDFAAYADDKERQQYLDLKNESVAKTMLIEGMLL